MKTINFKYLDKQYHYNALQEIVNNLEQDKIHLAFYIKNNSFKNYLNPLFALIRLGHAINNDFAVDHVGHLSRFIQDGDNVIARTFDAKLSGMEENNFIDNVKNYHGRVILATLGKVNKKKAKAFEKQFRHLPYGEVMAGLSGIDSDKIKFLEKKIRDFNLDKDQLIESLKYGKDALFCSFLVGLFLVDQGYNLKHIEEGKLYEMTPFNILQAVDKYLTKPLTLIHKL